MKAIVSIVLFILLFVADVGHGAGQESQRIDWQALRVAFAAYADYPSGANASKVISLLPRRHIKHTGDIQEQKTLDFIHDSYQLRMLERQVLSGDREAVRLGFNLQAIADGDFAEDLDIILGALIRVNPKLFLEGLNEFKGLFTIEALVGNQGEPYVDRLKARCYDAQLRIEALSTVKEERLKKVRDLCIRALRGQIKEYCKNV